MAIAVAAAESVLRGMVTPQRAWPVIDGRTRRCASQEGNALAVCSWLGLAADPRVAELVEWLVSWQWPDGGWNYSKKPTASRSSFHETLPPAWGVLSDAGWVDPR